MKNTRLSGNPASRPTPRAAKKLPQNRQTKRRGNPNPLPPPAEYQFKSRAELGGALDPRINVGGRPKLLGESYAAWLAKTNPDGTSRAEAVALAMGMEAIKGNVRAAREMREATEGTRQVGWQDRIIDALKSGALTVEDVRKELGADAESIIIASGIGAIAAGTAGVPSGNASTQSPDSAVAGDKPTSLDASIS